MQELNTTNSYNNEDVPLDSSQLCADTSKVIESPAEDNATPRRLIDSHFGTSTMDFHLVVERCGCTRAVILPF